jgi:NADPH2 dehydrogenase
MSASGILRLGTLRDVAHFKEHLVALGLVIPCDLELQRAGESPLAEPIVREGIKIGNRFAVQPMEGWDGTSDGNPSEHTLRRWRRFGRSGAKLIWGGEAVAVSHEGRANPNQLVAAPHTKAGLAQLREVLVEEHRHVSGSDDGLLIGLQLTHSGRYSCPNQKGRPEPRILYRHPILNGRLNLPPDYPLLSDAEIEGIIEEFHSAGLMASELGFDFVDIKHCHGYLGHEFLSAHTREGKYGGSFENRTRFLREVVQGVRAAAPGLRIGVRLSAFDTIPYRPDPALSAPGKPGPGIPVDYQKLIPYRWGFGVDQSDPRREDLGEPLRFLSLLEELGVQLLNLTAGSPYYCPHIQRPALYPPSDGYQPPHDPLIDVARQLEVVKQLKQRFPKMIIVGTAYSYLQDFLPHVTQAVVRLGWVDSIGLGRMVLSYPEILADVLQGRAFQHKLVCRTFSDCTTAPRNGLPSGCYPLDSYYKNSASAELLKVVKAARR